MQMDEYVNNLNGVQTGRWMALAGGGMLLLLGLGRRSLMSIPLTLAGGSLVYSAISDAPTVRVRRLHAAAGKGTATNASLLEGEGICAESSVTIDRSPEELYRFWRDLENLPRFAKHLKEVHVTDNTHSHWVAKGPANTNVEWDAEIINEIENELIGWRSVEGSDLPNAGSVHFESAPGGRGTVVKAEMLYKPPVGRLGAAVAQMFGEEPSQTFYEDLHHFKQLMEVGEIVATDGQSSGDRNRLRQSGV